MKNKHLIHKGYFLDWPFETGEPVSLYWIRSPYRAGIQKQWIMPVVFQRGDMTLQTIKVPWGALPLLRLGHIFQDGVPTGKNTYTEEIRLRFSSKANYKIQKAVQSVSPTVYPLKTRDNLSENCVIIFNEGQTIVIPCLELIRAFLIMNKMLAHHILQPFDFGDLLKGNLNGTEAKIEFTNKMPFYALNHQLIYLLAKIMFVPDWSESWQSVYTGREEQINSAGLNPNDSIPLKCIPALYQNCAWRIRALQDGKRLFVLEVLSYSHKYAFQTITYEHPMNQSSQIKKYLGGKGQTDNFGQDVGITTDESNPAKVHNPFLIKNIMTGCENIGQIKIKEESSNAEGKRSNPEVRKVPIITEKSPTELKSRLEVSLSEETGSGTTPAGEFVSEEIAEAPIGLKAFFKAIEAMKCLDKSIEYAYKIELVPVDSVMAYCGNSPREFVLVKVKVRNKCRFIVEFDLADNHSISTLIFGINREVKLNLLLNQLLTEYIVGQGTWDKQSVESIKEIDVTWAKHTIWEPYRWGRKLLRKIL